MTTNPDSADAIVSESLNTASRFLAEHNRYVRALDPNNMNQSVQDTAFAMERADKFIREAIDPNSKVTANQRAVADSCFPYLLHAITQLLTEVHRADTPLFKEQVIAMYAPKVTQAANSMSIALALEPRSTSVPKRLY